MQGHRHTVTSIDGTRIGLLTAGTGPALLLVHGGMGRLERWEPLWGLLTEHWQVTAMDRRVCRLEEESVKIWAKMESDKTEILLAGEARAEKLHNRINPIAAGLEGLKSAVELNNQQTVLLSAKLDRLMETRKA